MSHAAPVPVLGGEPLLRFLVAVTALLLVAFCLGRLAERVRLPAVVGELSTGVILGPSLLGEFAPDVAGWLLPAQPEQMHLVDAVGQIGILLLVALTGTHLDAGMLRRRRATVVTASLGGLIMPLGLGIALGLGLPATLRGPEAGGAGLFAFLLGVAMCVSAIPVIAKTLSDMRLLHRDIGQLALAAATIDDAVGWLLLSIVSVIAVSGFTTSTAVSAVASLAVFLAVAVAAGRPLVRRLMRAAGRSPSSGPTVAVAVLLVLLGAITTHALGMEPIFGAFVVGILIGLPGAADMAKLAGLRMVVLSVLAPLFLATAGLRMDLTALADPGVALAAVAVLTVAVVGKFGGVYLASRATRLSHWESLALGAGLNSRGVVELVVALTGLRLGVLNTASYTIVALVAIATSVLAPPLLRAAAARIEVGDGEHRRRLQHESWDNAPASGVAPAPNLPSLERTP
ncbi:cation:proton antiporter [Micromonospora robiginosa]|uniref:Cation:proton antiporter n=1 Tax=Micromonospora robiginosa TaxID=2749844 RepID=A0A7L6B3U9_9ACTN|nr:cation:proton antiporter [Micromonospora ferruginea]QLQ36511.1 cation:proton antiporter [Micromonospora ferruginea]